MRPLVLRVEGLRSYLAAQEVDFSRMSLFAVVGDTGAGKSSLLEAMSVALYATSTWSGRDVKSLIADGAPAMRVSLDFLAEGKTFRVTRVVARAAHPPPVHQLRCLNDDTIATRSGARDVNDEVKRLLGLDHDGFTRVVLLPQGRFQRLLQSSAAERASILKGILRLDVLDAIRSRAASAADRIRPGVDALRLERATLSAEPDEAAEGARAALEACETRVATCRATLEAVRVAGERRTTAQHAAAQARTSHARLGTAAEDHALRSDAESALMKHRDAQAALSELDAHRGTLERAAEDNAPALTRRAEILQAHAIVTHALAASARVRDDDAALAALRTQLEDATRELVEHERAMTKRDEEVRAARHAAAQCHQEADLARRAAEQARAVDARRHERASRHAALEHDARAASQALASARAHADESAARFAEASEHARAEEIHVLRERFAAEHVAGGPCPVCERPWAPPPAGARTPSCARVVLETHAQALQAARASLAAAEARSLERARALLALGGDDPHCDGVADSASAALRFEALMRAAVEAEQRAQESAAAKAASAARLDEKRAQRDTRSADLATRTAALVRARAALDEALGGLPSASRPQGADIHRLEVLRLSLEREKTATERATRDATQSQEQLRAVHVARASQLARQETDVLAPVRDLEGRLARLQDALRASGLHDSPALPRPLAATDAPAVVNAFLEALELSRQGCDALVRTSVLEERAADDQLSRLLGDAGCETVAGLDERLIDARMNAELARRDVARALADAPRARDLDRRVGAVAPLLGSLEELARLLSDGRFTSFVVAERQRVLLAVASDVLGELTKGRFGFAADFAIVDRHTGELRDPIALSGGETFLASLALALGLVEVAGRAGGRLDALFLDEGFGSLDSDTLEAALEALARQAARGRLVGVISHLRSVAERFEDVLSVTRGPRGSEVVRVTVSPNASASDAEGPAAFLLA